MSKGNGNCREQMLDSLYGSFVVKNFSCHVTLSIESVFFDFGKISLRTNGEIMQIMDIQRITFNRNLFHENKSIEHDV